MLTDARPAALLALASLAVVLADARPATLLALASLAVMLADARPAAFLATASYAVVLADARSAALRKKKLSWLLGILPSGRLLTPVRGRRGRWGGWPPDWGG